MNEHNNVTLQGQLSFDAEVKDITSKKTGKEYQLGRFKMACKAGKGMLYIDINVWDVNLIGIVKQLSKGDEVIVTGELRSEGWQTTTGERRTKHLVVADNIKSCSVDASKVLDTNDDSQDDTSNQLPF